jgi:hypothetical protein
MNSGFEPFKAAFHDRKSDGGRSVPLPKNVLIDENPEFRALLNELGGNSLNLGIYRLLESQLFEAATDFVAAVFPAWYYSLAPFASDWMGRIFAIDGSDRRLNGERCVSLLDPATRDLLQVPASLTAFHNDMLVNEPELPLEAELWKSWLAIHPQGLGYDELAGWRRPAFLGGELVVENLEIQPARVYWDISGQLIVKAFKLKPGTRIRSVEIQ